MIFHLDFLEIRGPIFPSKKRHFGMKSGEVAFLLDLSVE